MANLVTFAKKLWKDKVGGNTPITAAELNRMEDGINDCATQINKLGDSVSRKVGMGNGVISSCVNVNTATSMPIQIEIESSMGKFTAIFAMEYIGLYSAAEDKFLWRIKPTAVSSDPLDAER